MSYLLPPEDTAVSKNGELCPYCLKVRCRNQATLTLHIVKCLLAPKGVRRNDGNGKKK